MMKYYHRDGTPYPPGMEGLLAFLRDKSDTKLSIVQQDTLENGYFVSTVWLGLDHNFFGGPPLIFETMVFTGGRAEDYQERYATENDAIIGHLKAVDEYAKKPSRVR